MSNAAEIKRGRISFPEPESMSDAQRVVYEQVISGPRGRLVGPLRAALHNPELADAWQRLGLVLRYETCLPRRLNELAILVTARRWNSDLEWAIHERDAVKAGLQTDYADAIRTGSVPSFGDDEEATEIYEFAWQVLQRGDANDATHAAIVSRWGETGVVELTALLGYYSMVAMTLTVHRIPIPDEYDSRLPRINGRLAEMPE